MWVAFIPFAAFGAAFTVGAVALWFLVRTTKISEAYTPNGKTLHVVSPLGIFDQRREAKLDPRLARIPAYAGAVIENPAVPESVTELRFGGTTLRDISVTYSTGDSAQQVWDFYRQELRNWAVSPDNGKELLYREGEYVLLVRIWTQGQRTMIEHCIKPPDYPLGFGS